MASKPMTRREAQNWRKRALEAEDILERNRRWWAKGWFDGEWIAGLEPTAVLYAQVEVVRKLKHAVVVVANNGRLEFFAMPIAKDSSNPA